MASEYQWKDISVVILGRTIEGIVDVSYKDSEELEYVRGRGDKPLAIVSGNFSCEGKITLLQSELMALRDVARKAGKRLTEISFDITHSYENAEGVATTDQVIGARVKETEQKIAQGDKFQKVDLPYMALDIRYNV
jgi:hypothetical protein